jgi:hypothetical protein
MAGTNQQITCLGFIETEGFARSKERLKQLLELTDRDVDDRIEALIWAFQRADPNVPLASRIGNRNLWVARVDHPPLRVFMRPRPEVPNECELLWIEEAD